MIRDRLGGNLSFSWTEEGLNGPAQSKPVFASPFHPTSRQKELREGHNDWQNKRSARRKESVSGEATQSSPGVFRSAVCEEDANNSICRSCHVRRLHNASFVRLLLFFLFHAPNVPMPTFSLPPSPPPFSFALHKLLHSVQEKKIIEMSGDY